MATIAGKDADITVAGYDYYSHAWSMDIVCEALEDTNWDWTGDDIGWHSFQPGLKGWSGSFECYIDAAHDPLLPCGEIATAKFYIDLANTLGYSGSIFITAIHPGVTIEGKEAVTVDFQGTGGLTVGNIS